MRGRQSWDHLRILEVVDHGRWGRAFRTVDGRTGEARALTIGARPGGEIQLLEFEQRARVRHPSLPRVIEVGLSPVAIEDLRAGSPFLLTEWIAGTRCDRAARPLPARAAQIAAWIGDVAGALAALHAVGLVHGGVEPRRVVLADDGRGVLIGFGLGPGTDAAPVTGDAGAGGLDQAPEAWAGELEPRSDVHGLGATAVRVITGCPPSSEDELPQLRELPHPLADLVCQMMARDPDHRPRSALAVLDELERRAGSSGDAAPRRVVPRVAAPAAPMDWPGAAAMVDAIADGLARGAVAAVIGPPAAGAHELVERAVVRHTRARTSERSSGTHATRVSGALDDVAAALDVAPEVREAGAPGLAPAIAGASGFTRSLADATPRVTAELAAVQQGTVELAAESGGRAELAAHRVMIELDVDITAPHALPFAELDGELTAPHEPPRSGDAAHGADVAEPAAASHAPDPALDQSLGRSLDRSLDQSLDRSLDRVALELASVADPVSRLSASAVAWIERVARAARRARAPVVIDLVGDPRTDAVLGALLRAGGANPVIAIVDQAPPARPFDGVTAGDALAALLDQDLRGDPGDDPSGDPSRGPGDDPSRDREPAPGADPVTGQRGTRRSALVRHVLPELDDEAVAAVVAALHGTRPPRAWVHALRIAAGGLPCTVIDLLRSIAGEPQPLGVDWTARTARGLADLRSRQLRAASAGARRVVAAIAAWGGQARIDRALAALRGEGRGSATLADVAELERAGLAHRRGDHVVIDRTTSEAIEGVLGSEAIGRIATAALDDELARRAAGPLARSTGWSLAPVVERATLDEPRAALACEVAEHLLARGRVDRALVVAQRALAVAPVRAASVAACAAAVVGDFARAEVHAAAAATAGGDPVQTQLTRAYLAMRSGAAEAAGALLAELRAVAPDDATVAAACARWLVDHQRYQQAAACATAGGHEPPTVACAEVAGLAALHLGDLVGADAAFARAEVAAAARGDRGSQAHALALRARVAHRREQLGLACDRYRAAMRGLSEVGELPAAAIAERELGRLLIERGRAGDALPRLAAARRVLAELGATSAWGTAELRRGEALLALGQLADAIAAVADLQAAAATARELEGPAQLLAGEVRLRLADRAAAIACFRAALAAGIATADREIQLAAHIALARSGERPAEPAAITALCVDRDDHDRWTLARGQLARCEIAARPEREPERRDALAAAISELARDCAALAIRAAQRDRRERAFRGHAVAAQLARHAGRADLAHEETARARLAHAAWRAAFPPAFRAVIDGDPDLISSDLVVADLRDAVPVIPAATLPSTSRPIDVAPPPTIPTALDGDPALAQQPTEEAVGTAATTAKLVPSGLDGGPALAQQPAEDAVGTSATAAKLVPLGLDDDPALAQRPAEHAVGTSAAAAILVPAALDGDPALAQRPAEDAVGTAASPGEPDPMASAGELAGLRRLLALSRRFHSEIGMERILDELIDAAIDLGRAQRGFVLVRQPGGELAVVVARNLLSGELGPSGSGPVTGSLSRGLAEHAARTGEPIAMIDAGLAAYAVVREALGPCASGGTDGSPAPPAAAPRPRAVLAVPLRQRGAAIGSLYLDRPMSDGGFDTAAAVLLGELADIAALALDNAQRCHALARAAEPRAAGHGARDKEFVGEDLRLRPALAATEQAYVRAAMTRARGNQTAAARLLGLSRFGLQKKLRRLTVPSDHGRTTDDAGDPAELPGDDDPDLDDGASGGPR